MSYLLDKKIKRKKFFSITLGVLFFIILFYFRFSVFGGLSYVAGGIFRPVLVVGNNVGEKLKSIGSYFAFKNSLYLQNEKLLSQVKENDARMANYDSVVAENISLKETLLRKNEKANMILSAILSKPNKSPYDTLVIDVGTTKGIKIGNMVFAKGNIPIGRIGEANENSSKVILFSNSGEKIQVVITSATVAQASKDVFMELVGRGGGNFEMILPRDFTLAKGDQVSMPGVNSYLVAIAETVISDPRDPFIKALLTSPVNIQELKFVEVAF